MNNKFLLVLLLICTFVVPTYAEISSVHHALEVVKFLDVLKEQHSDAFMQKNVRYAVEDVLAFFESSNDFNAEQRSMLFNKLRGYLELIEDFDAQEGASTRYLNPDQSLTSYWTQLYGAIHTILDTNNSSTSNALNLQAPPAGFNYTYTLYMPMYQGSANQVLTTDGNNPAQLSWITTITADVSALYTATSCDNYGTLVLRDANGNFAASTITLANQTLLTYNPGGNGTCTGSSAIFTAPGTQNIFVGQQVGNTTLTGANNIAVGQSSMASITSGHDNSAHGVSALSAVTSGSYNSAFGNFALQTVTTGSGNTAIGYGADVNAANATNRTAVGAGTIATANNSVALGNAAVTTVVPTSNGTASLGTSSNLWNTVNTLNTAFYNGIGGSAATIASAATSNYTLQLPTAAAASQYQVLGNLTTGGTELLGWITTVTSSQAINLVYTATSCDSPNTLVLRDASGNFVANTISLGVSGGNLINYSATQCGPGSSILSVNAPSANTIVLGNGTITNVNPAVDGTINLGSASARWDALNTYTTNYYSGANAVTVAAAPGGTASYNLYWPTVAGTQGYVLEAQNTGSPTQLQWVSVSSILGGTYCDFPNTVVQRDQNGSFAATTITLTAVNLLNYNPVLNSCPSNNATTAFLSIPGTNNLFLGQSAGSQTITGNGGNVAVGRQALTGITSGTSNTALGYNALAGISTGYNNVAVGLNAGSGNATGANNIYLGPSAIGSAADTGVIAIGINNASGSGTYINGIFNTPLTGINPFVGITSNGQLGTLSQGSITTLTVTTSLYVDSLNGAVIATNGLLTATVGIDGTRLASFPLTDTPPVTFFQPVEPSRESYFFDDFLSFNNTAGDMFYGDTQWVIGNNTAARVTALTPTSSAIGITQLYSGAGAGNNNYLIKQLNGTGASSLAFSPQTGYCLNEWRVAIPTVSSVTNSFTTRVGFGDNPTARPNNGIYFSCDETNSGNWFINTAAGGTVTSQVTNPATAPTAGVYQRLGFQVNNGGTSVNFFINDNPVGTISANIPLAGTANACSPFAAVVRRAGTGGSINLDYWYFHYTFNTRR